MTDAEPRNELEVTIGGAERRSYCLGLSMPEYVKITNVNTVLPGKMKQFRVAGRAILIVNVEGRFYATDDTCTHEEASLSSGSLHGELVKCPLHGSRFNVRTGEALGGASRGRPQDLCRAGQRR